MARGHRTRYGNARRALALSLLLSGCFGGQTGQESSAMHEDPDPCKTAMSRPIGIDEDTPLGYRPRDIAAETTFGERLPFEWHRPEASTGEVRVDFYLDIDGARWVSSDRCPGFVAIDTEILISNERLQARFKGVLKMTGAQEANFSGTVPVAEVRGPFRVEDVADPSPWADPELRLQLSITGGDVHGQLYLEGRDANPNDNSTPVSAALGSF